jgi:type II secretory pathway pseudopilin PulG
MDTGVIVAIVVVAVLAVVAVGVWMSMQRGKESKRLREHYGSEYDRAVMTSDNRREAEKELESRKARVERLHIRELQPAERDRYADAWRATQTRFVDDPVNAIEEADNLVQEVMNLRGYPITNFEQQAADVSVDHPEVVRNYRAAHEIAEASERNQATTEDLRQAMVHYRSLFAELLGASPVGR